MSTSTISTNDLANLQVGDKSSLDENHPRLGRSGERDLGRRLGSGFWYDLATGLQDDSGATRIERCA
ncbi:hypothetical protein ACF082_34320 [Streptomyces lydicus]|uniref:hypothetical protein n=1 Tax=Streptomyces lydicus TaxID=47763 RepID=UPI0036F4D189